MSRVRAALIQVAVSDDLERNLVQASDAVAAAAADGAQVVCLPELFRSRYFPQHEDAGCFDLAEPIPGPTTERLSELAREYELVIVGSVFERRAAGLYHNTALIYDVDGELRTLYRKMHIPHDPRYFEKYYFTPGDTPFVAAETRYGRLGVLVCWDQWFPEAARLAALHGVQMLFYPTAIGWEIDEPEDERRADHDAWRTVQRAHAISNGLFVAATNRVGVEGELEFWGASFVADPFGRVLAEAEHDRATTLLVDCDFGAIEATRREWPFLRDRRPEAYSALTKRFLER